MIVKKSEFWKEKNMQNSLFFRISNGMQEACRLEKNLIFLGSILFCKYVPIDPRTWKVSEFITQHTI